MARMQCPGFVRLITRYRRAEHAGKHVERGFDNGSYDYRYCQCRYPSRILRYRWHAHQFHDPYGTGFHNRGDSPAEAAGVKVLICTGRAPSQMHVVLDTMPVTFDDVVAFNGQYCFDDTGFFAS